MKPAKMPLFCQDQDVVLTFSPCSLCLHSFEIKGQKVIKINLSGGLPGQSTSWFSKHKENADLAEDSSQALISIFKWRICIHRSNQSHVENMWSELTNYSLKFKIKWQDHRCQRSLTKNYVFGLSRRKNWEEKSKSNKKGVQQARVS